MRTQADIDALGATKKLAPKVTDFIGRKGFTHRQEKRADGVVEDVVSWTPNVNGKKTNAALEVEEAMRPHGDAETARQTELQGRAEREPMVDADGGVRYVAAPLADSAAKRNGWRHQLSAGGVVGVSMSGAYERGAATFCERCERHREYCECEGER